MSTLQRLIEEIRRQPESRLLEVWHYLKFLEQVRDGEDASRRTVSSQDGGPPSWPDFEGRLMTIYGDRVGRDSQEALDYLREERA